MDRSDPCALIDDLPAAGRAGNFRDVGAALNSGGVRPPTWYESRVSCARFSDRMSDADAVMWKMEADPILRSTIVCVSILDRAPRWQGLLAKLEHGTIPRLYQRAVADPLGIAPPAWEDDPHFDIAFHVRRHGVPGDGSLRALMDAGAPLGMQAFDRERPLWELHLYEGLEGGRAAVILKLHHAISDGIGLVGMISGFVEFSREGDAKQAADVARPPRRAVPGALLLTRRALADRARKNLARGRGLVSFAARKLPSLARHPIETTRSAANGVRSLARLLVPSSGPMSRVMTERSMSCRFDVVFVPLADLKSAAKAAGGTVNDAFVAAVTSGLRRYHERFGAPVHELRMNMAINVRDSAADSLAGNQFLPVRFLVPVAILDPRERIREIRRRIAAQRSEPALSAVDEIASFLSALPGDSVARIAGGLMRTVDFSTSNVPGPSMPLYMSGAKIERCFGFGPCGGGALNITCLSYAGELAMAINVDPAAVTAPSVLAECIRNGCDEVLALAPIRGG